MVMFFLVWLFFTNNYVEIYQIGSHYETMKLCKSAEAEAMVLVTNSKTRLLCFEVVIK